MKESVWSYPRPPRLERTGKRLRAVHAGQVIADAPGGWRVLETSHPPTYYVARAYVREEFLRRSRHRTFCEFKGHASYFDVVVGDDEAERAAWYYPNPTPEYAELRDAIAFYAGRVDECYVDDERVAPEPGGFYGGWITGDVQFGS